MASFIRPRGPHFFRGGIFFRSATATLSTSLSCSSQAQNNLATDRTASYVSANSWLVRDADRRNAGKETP